MEMFELENGVLQCDVFMTFTLGLILASLMGGPIASLLVARHDLKPEKVEPMDAGLSEED